MYDLKDWLRGDGAGEKAGVERRVHAHGLRHAFAVDLVRSGAPLYVVRDALGHASIATTQVYLSRVGAHEAVDAMRNREPAHRERLMNEPEAAK